MPAPPPESEPAIVSIAGVPPPLCTGNGFIVVKVKVDGTQISRFGAQSTLHSTHLEILTV